MQLPDREVQGGSTNREQRTDKGGGREGTSKSNTGAANLNLRSGDYRSILDDDLCVWVNSLRMKGKGTWN